MRSAVDAVQDPELHRSLGELDMIRAVTTGRSGRVDIELALTTAACPMTELLTRDVTSAASAVPRTGDVHVSFTVMTESERRALAERFLANRTAGRCVGGLRSVRGRQRQGRRRQVECCRQLGRGPCPAGQVGRSARRRRVGLFGAAAVRSAAQPNRHVRDHVSGPGPWRSADVPRLLGRGRRTHRLARSDAA